MKIAGYATFIFSFILLNALLLNGVALAAKGADPRSEAEKLVDPPLYPYDSFYRGRGVDLVVSKVLLEQGVFGGREQIRYKVWVKNICNEATDRRIKVAFRDLSFGSIAIWVEGGLGPGEVKESAFYYLETDEYRCCGTQVTVDSDNEIPEINNDNNSCNASFRPSTQTRNETLCWRGGIRCIDPPAEEGGPTIPDLKLRRDIKR